jgi:single-strand DNA-binding protein
MINVNVIGRLGADAELKSGKNGEQFVNFRLATNEFNKSTKTNETVWMNVILFGKRAVTMHPYLKKGSFVNVMGEERVSLYQLKSGEYAINRDVLADRLEFIGSSNKSDENTTTSTNKFVSETPLTPTTAKIQEPQMAYADMGTMNAEDDLPF